MPGPETSSDDSDRNDGSSSPSSSRSSSEADDEVQEVELAKMNQRAALKKQMTVKKMQLLHHSTKELTENMNYDQMQQLVRLNSDMVNLHTAKGAKPADEMTQLKIFQRAAKKVRSASAFKAAGRLGEMRRASAKGSNDFEGLERLRAEHLAEEAKQQQETRLKMSGLGKFFTKDLAECHHEDFDPGVNAMALLCGLVLSVPYTVVEGLNYEHMDWLKATIALCPKGDRDYNFVYNVYRATYTSTVYFSVSGMIIATFYFLFKRNDDDDYRLWRNKARWMVLLMFISTAMAIISLIFLTNIYFEYFLINTETDICDAGTAPYTYFGMALGGITFVGSLYLIL